MLGAEPLLVGRTLGGDTIESWLGRGSNATVYLATHARLRCRVALKVPSADARDEPDVRARFLLESQLAASLDHPSVILNKHGLAAAMTRPPGARYQTAGSMARPFRVQR